MQNLLARFATDESAATAIEYAVIAGGVSLAIGAVIHGLGPALNNIFARVSASLGRDQWIVTDVNGL